MNKQNKMTLIIAVLLAALLTFGIRFNTVEAQISVPIKIIGDGKPKCHHNVELDSNYETSFCAGTTCSSRNGKGSTLAKCG
jgi:hypothetical protein